MPFSTRVAIHPSKLEVRYTVAAKASFRKTSREQTRLRDRLKVDSTMRIPVDVPSGSNNSQKKGAALCKTFAASASNGSDVNMADPEMTDVEGMNIDEYDTSDFAVTDAVRILMDIRGG
ncbi:hypothetical protein MBM_05480 [Drepanopeziza brunnea f. sp. 'multigermtubi' MB_m1]|uniref:Uncharacterized protein n=1 Tax=Marssonina brunnea f. sp. multigermtubi (strain MB_m1) TaxID=1072389 RepID=K1WT17_MARBU|nr:uncharacterized protein MBM_05480 [Drepanopeziza brunnea f. sp. 'multigermtubi' MB_m1]EKD16186.1 hypothetical protein MBM_05480 [Drepanopeziza brunnea f. sp. 'multigermtubi' MB_m1]